jgi:5'-phosphate synthase pdxT subunit
MVTVGVCALQGAFREHCEAIESLGHTAVEVRNADDLASIDGLIIPGGESTAMLLIAKGPFLVPVHSCHTRFNF